MNFMIIYAVKLYLTGQASTTAMPLYVLSRLVLFHSLELFIVQLYFLSLEFKRFYFTKKIPLKRKSYD